jgi:ferredoxin-type protein NapF
LNQTPRREEARVRWTVRALCLVLALALAWPVVPLALAPVVVPALSPFVATASLLTTRTFDAWMLPGIAVGVIALVWRRWFCRWVCPTGTCADATSLLGRRLGRKCPRLPPLGQWIALATLAGACLGYPLLLWLDPLAVFAAPLGMFGPSFYPACYGAILLVLILLASLLLPGVWCLRLCPLGATQELLASPMAAIRSRRSPAETRGEAGEGRLSARRAVLAAVVGAICGAAARTVRAAAPRPLRPPGARDDASFVALCTRCGACVRSCPHRILGYDLEHGLAAFLTPSIAFREDYCREDCTRCMQVCPSGALQRLAADEKVRHPIGVPRVDMNLCLLGEDRECALCRSHCPLEAIRYVFSETDYTLIPRIDLQRCSGCGACQIVCPTHPVKAIVVVPVDAPQVSPGE